MGKTYKDQNRLREDDINDDERIMKRKAYIKKAKRHDKHKDILDQLMDKGFGG
jgi:hypothetical protein